MASSGKIIKGNLTLIVLRLLYNHTRLYGYEIVKAVQKASNGRIVITEAALYPTLHQLEEHGLVTVKPAMADGRLRKYYQLNRKGKQAAENELTQFEEHIAILRKVLRFTLKNHSGTPVR